MQTCRDLSIRCTLAAFVAGGVSLPGGALAGPVPILFDGQQHTAVGAATLSVTPDDHLLVSNIGSSGNDGVSVQLGAGSSGFWTNLPLDSAMPVGAYMESRFFGLIGGLPNQPAGTLGLLRTSAGFDAIVDFSPLGSPTYTVELRDENGVLLHSESGLVSGDVQLALGPGLPIDCWCDWVRKSWTWRVDWPWNATTTSGANVIAHEVTFLPDTPYPSEQITHVEMVGANMPAFEILGEELGVFGNFHTAQGDITFEATDDGTGRKLKACCLGSSGKDGVEVKFLVATPGVGIEWEPIDPGAPDGAYLEFGATGETGGLSNVPLGTMRITDAGSEYELVADYSPVGSMTELIRVFNDGVMVGEFPGQSGVVATVPSWPGGCTKRIIGVGPWQTSCFAPNWPGDIPITIPGARGPVVLMGDEIAVLAEAPSGSLDAINSFSFAGADFGELTITSEGVDPLVSVGEGTAWAGTFAVSAPYPNPFRTGVSLTLTTIEPGAFDVGVYDVSGRLVRRLDVGAQVPGVRTVTWDGADGAGALAASGVYFFRVRGGGEERIVKGMLVR